MRIERATMSLVFGETTSSRNERPAAVLRAILSNVMFLTGFLLGLSLAATALPFGSALSDEEYAVYSAALGSGIRLSHADHNQTLVIVRDMLDPWQLPVPTEDCSNVPSELRRRMKDVLDANREHSAIVSGPLEFNKLAIGRPYVLVSSQQGNRWQQSRSQPQIPTNPATDQITDDFPRSTDLILVSRVLFNGNKTVALVCVSARCGALCGSSGWDILEKTKGGWHILSTANCGTIN